jgi:hypothetical protein
MILGTTLCCIIGLKGNGVLPIFFSSKKDILYSLAVWGTAVIVLLFVILDFSLTIFGLFWVFIGLLSIGFLMWIWFGTGYQIENDTIKIQNGPFKYKINIVEINRISKRKSVLATPALSVDRLALHYGKYGEMLISPKNEMEFTEILLTKNPQIKVDEKIFTTK